MTHDYLKSNFYTKDKILSLFEVAKKVKNEVKQRQLRHVLDGYVSAMIFQKPSLRTRCTFDIGMYQLGGKAIYLGPSEISLGVRESAYDIAKNLERWCDIIVARVFAQKYVEDLAQASSIPVINALSDDEHPCQAMADYFTLWENGLSSSNLALAYIGDGNNVCVSLMLIGAILGCDFRAVCPKGYEPDAKYVDEANEYAKLSGGKVTVTSDIQEGIKGTDAIYTDTWASMHHTEEEARERFSIFLPYQVNKKLLEIAKPGAFAMHCLPAHRNEEITDEVMDSKQSIVFDEAENRLHMQKMILLDCLDKIDSL